MPPPGQQAGLIKFPATATTAKLLLFSRGTSHKLSLGYRLHPRRVSWKVNAGIKLDAHASEIFYDVIKGEMSGCGLQMIGNPFVGAGRII